MQIKIINIIENKNGIYTINFERFDEEDDARIKNWTTFKKNKDNYKFSGNIYVKNKLKRAAYEMYDSNFGIKKFPDPELHYDSILTADTLKMLYNEKVFQDFIKEKGISFIENDLFVKGSILREENLIKLIKVAFERDEQILAIFDNGTTYTPLIEHSVGFNLYDEIDELENIELDGISKKEKEKLNISLKRLIKKIGLSSKTDYVAKYETSIFYYVNNKGKEDNDIHPFGWELPEDTIFFDELFFLDTIPRLAEEALKRYDLRGPVVDFETGEVEFLKQSECDEFDDDYIMDTIICDYEDIFIDAQFEFDINNNGNIKKIKEILKKLD